MSGLEVRPSEWISETHSRSILRERFEDLQLYILALCRTTPEGGGAAHDKRMGPLLVGHGLYELFEGAADARIGVGRHDERVALAVQYRLRRRGVGFDDADDLETRAELVLQAERVVPWSLIGSLVWLGVLRYDSAESS